MAPRGYVSVSVTPELTDWLAEISEETSIPRAQLVRFILEMVQRDRRLLRRALNERLTDPGNPAAG